MRRRVLIFSICALGLTVAYEATFRYVTASSGLVDMQQRQPRIIYSNDSVSFPWRRMLFGFRTRLPFGKVKLWPEHLYVDGGKIYSHLPDGGWMDMTNGAIEH